MRNQKSFARTHSCGLDVLGGFDVGSFVPWLSGISSIASGFTGGGSDDKAKAAAAAAAAAAAEAAQRRKEEEAAKTRNYILAGVGVLGVGVIAMVLLSRGRGGGGYYAAPAYAGA